MYDAPIMLNRIRDHYASSAWATTRILDTAERLDPEQFLAEHAGAGSIRDILVHTASAQAVWLGRWRGDAPSKAWDPTAFPDIATLRAAWSTLNDATAEYLAGIRDADLDQSVSYVNSAGETWSYPRWQMLLHQVNHATQHRSEVALLLTQAGHSPGDLDFLRYFDERVSNGGSVQ
ncbi:MAG: DinB family protein [Chloroflexota bacterium]|nr:DinB family protein [Chloroflexota bacterium]